jgi:hypothetical protein
METMIAWLWQWVEGALLFWVIIQTHYSGGLDMDTPDLTKQLLALADCLSELGLSELTVRKEDGDRVRIVVGDEFTHMRQDYKKRRD